MIHSLPILTAEKETTFVDEQYGDFRLALASDECWINVVDLVRALKISAFDMEKLHEAVETKYIAYINVKIGRWAAVMPEGAVQLCGLGPDNADIRRLCEVSFPLAAGY